MKFIHYIPTSRKGGVTIAYELQENNQGKKLVFAVAQVSKKDNYCKKIGRDVSLDRFIKGETLSLVVKGNKKALQYRIETYLSYIAANINYLQAGKV
jgi:hypothetical protein